MVQVVVVVLEQQLQLEVQVKSAEELFARAKQPVQTMHTILACVPAALLAHVYLELEREKSESSKTLHNKSTKPSES